ncbi:MAG: hypothetical protein DRO11_08870 [Methanobacteriota archaeon]|nr:MAG: hypothetical protein DRO11_08870 [Euryarchaeota archaeon]
MKILIACEFSGTVRNAFRKRGHDAWSCDLLPAEDQSEYHIQGDVREILDDGWDMMIAHPPCTYLCNSGVRWLHEKLGRWEKLKEAAEFFRILINAPIDRICIENPIPHRYAVELIGRKYDQLVQPWMFGARESKATCFWLKNLPPLKPLITEKPENVRQRIWKLPPSPERWKERSRTYPEIARAMAEQWG